MNSNLDPSLDLQIDSSQLPAHVAVIMDGNGRWAQKRLLNRIKGHEKGSEAVRTIVRTCREVGIGNLTLYAFSTENWQRPKAEVGALMALLKKFLTTEKPELVEKGIRLGVIGQITRLPVDVQAALQDVMAATDHNRGLNLFLALSYGGRTEIVEMVRRIAAQAASGHIRVEDIDETLVAEHLYTRQIPDPDLLIRTSGEMRISNFLLWQIAYSEIYVTDTLWPDFSREEFLNILRDFQGRERRFGKVGLPASPKTIV